MKKLTAYMLLAIVVYVLIYLAILGYMRFQSADTRNFCEKLQAGILLQEIELKADQAGLVGGITEIENTEDKVIFISATEQSDAVCKGLIRDNKLADKKFVLSVF